MDNCVHILDNVDEIICTSAIFSKLAYSNSKSEVEQQLSTVAQETYYASASLVHFHTRYICILKHDLLYVAFRGTDNHNVGITNICFTPKTFSYTNPTAKVHGGYLTYYQGLRNSLMNIIEDHALKNKNNIILTGHSLGGSIAMLCAYDLGITSKQTNKICVTFGTPMTGNLSFCQDFEKHVQHSFHVTCGADIAPRIPIPGFAHVGQRLALPAQRRNTILDPIIHHNIDHHVDSLKMHRPSSFLTSRVGLITIACFNHLKAAPGQALFRGALKHLKPIV